MTPIQRRQFIKNSGFVAGGLLLLNKAFAGTLTSTKILHNIPVNKGLNPTWVRSLYNKGAATTYSKTKNELRYIGMPAGGLHTGTVYFGGDGRLWLWGIYNDEREGIDPKDVRWNDGETERVIKSRDGSAYIEPAIANNKRLLEQGIAIKFEYGNTTIVRELKESDWQEVKFEATYPHATVTYTDDKLPFTVKLTGGPVFIPTNAADSSLPATVLHVEIINTGRSPVKATVLGWLENGAGKLSAAGTGTKYSEHITGSGFAGVGFSFDGQGEPGERDNGTMAIAMLGENIIVNTAFTNWPSITSDDFTQHQQTKHNVDVKDKQVGSVATIQSIQAGKSVSVPIVIAWHFNHPLKKLLGKLPDAKDGYYYATKFNNATAVVSYLAGNFNKLYSATRRWQKLWYNSSLPHWLLERTIINTGTIATANTYRFADGRFWGWEGVNACEGTCTHVWQYAQALGRLFPELERDTRQRVDLGVAMQQDGGIIFRAEFESRPAIDGQAGTILRCYREHQTSADNNFLQHNWPNIKRAVTFLLAQDRNGDGMTDTPMENTLDAVWDGEIAWIVGLSIAAVKAGCMMAEEAGDKAFAETCRSYVEKGSVNIAEKLFNGEYFIHRPDAVKGRKALGGYNTCHIDQVYGQSWAYQVGLGKLWDNAKTKEALQALWKYNFTKDVGPYIATHTGGRPYALAGEGGMIMNTNPANEEKPYGENVTWQMGYFHECMSGFEHQVAAHMMAEGMTDESLVLTRMIHERYHGSKRNPYNEIECSDHYARAMASYGTFITACGFYYHGPQMAIGFNPAINAGNFSAAFTAAEGWGSYAQQATKQLFICTYAVHYGTVKLVSFKCMPQTGHHPTTVTVKTGSDNHPCQLTMHDETCTVTLQQAILLTAGEELVISLT